MDRRKHSIRQTDGHKAMETHATKTQMEIFDMLRQAGGSRQGWQEYFVCKGHISTTRQEQVVLALLMWHATYCCYCYGW